MPDLALEYSMADVGETTPWVVTVLAALAGGGGVWGWMTEKAKAKARAPADAASAAAEIAKAQAAFQEALNSQANGFLTTLLQEREAREKLIREQQKRIDDLDSRIIELEAENFQCRGENRQMGQRLDSLEILLRKNGIDVPAKDFERGIVEFRDGRARVQTIPVEKPEGGAE